MMVHVIDVTGIRVDVEILVSADPQIVWDLDPGGLTVTGRALRSGHRGEHRPVCRHPIQFNRMGDAQQRAVKGACWARLGSGHRSVDDRVR
jgi:hypothetical protein